VTLRARDKDFGKRTYSPFRVRAEVYGPCEIALQSLAKSENLIVHGASGRMIQISPHFSQQFVAAGHAIRMLHKKLQGLET